MAIMNKVLLVSIAFFIISCSHQDNQLIGTWVFNGDKTFEELSERQDIPNKILQCYKSKACGYNTVFTYGPDSWTQHFTFQEKAVTGPFSYEIVRNVGSEIEIKTTQQGEAVQFTTYFTSPSEAYVTSEWDGVEWREYLRKMH